MTIHELLADRGLTIDALAEKVGVDASTLSAYAQGNAKPTKKVLASIKKAYGVEVDMSAPAAPAGKTAETRGRTEEAKAPEAQAVEAAAAEQTVEAAAAQQTEEVAAAEQAVEAVAAQQTEEVAAAQQAVEAAAAQQTEEVAAAQQAVEAAAAEQTEEVAAAEQAEEVAAAEQAVEAAAAQQAEEVAALQQAVEAAAAQQAAEVAALQQAVETAAAQQAAEVAALQQAVETAAVEQAAEIAAVEQAVEAVAEEQAAEIAALEAVAESEAARKAAKKAKKAAKKQKADEEAAQWVAEAIKALGDSVDLSDEDAVIAARDAYDSLTYDQEQLIPGNLLNMPVSAEHMIEAASKTFPIEDCWITVKDIPYTGKKIKAPTVKVECGDMKLKEGEDYTLSYDKKARDIGLYLLNIKGEGRFTGAVAVPFYVFPKAKMFIKMMGGNKDTSQYWKYLKHIKGCQIKYSLNEDFSDSRKEKIKKPKDLEKLIKKLKAGKKYYVRARVYATINKEKFYSDWSKVKTLET